MQDCRCEHSYVSLNYKRKTSQIKKTSVFGNRPNPPYPTGNLGSFFFAFVPKIKSKKSIWAGGSPPRHTIFHFFSRSVKNNLGKGVPSWDSQPQFRQCSRKRVFFSGTSSLRVNIISGSVDSTTLLISPAEPFRYSRFDANIPIFHTFAYDRIFCLGNSCLSSLRFARAIKERQSPTVGLGKD